MARIHLVSEIAAPPDVCFDAARDVTVHLASFPTHTVVGGVAAGPRQLGDEVTWRAPHFGIVWRMTSKIIEYERPLRFVDAMRRGPFARWRHEHRFVATATGTRMIDDVDFASPLGPLGRVVDRLLLERFMTTLLRKHTADVVRAAEAGVVERAAGEREPRRSRPHQASGSTSMSAIDLPPIWSSQRCTRREN